MFRLNRVLSALLAGCIIFMLAGCETQKKQEQTQEKTQPPPSKFKFENVSTLPEIAKQNTKSVTAPVDIPNYTYSNGIKFEYAKYPQANTSDGNSFNYMKIRGLADKEVENKINQKLYDEYAALYNKGLPPYRGIRQIATDDKDVQVSMMYEVESSNISNILSVNLSKDMTLYNKVKNEYYYINDMTTLNFNLKNGELITLSDLFADNCDYKKIINEQIEKFILSKNIDGGDTYSGRYDEGLASIKVISPFNGISDNQKYYI